MKKGYINLKTKIDESNKLIQDIDIASKEQLKSIEQINDTVSILDQNTQQNSSIANETQNITNELMILSENILKYANEKNFREKR